MARVIKIRLAILALAIFLYPSLIEYFCLSSMPSGLARGTLMLSPLVFGFTFLLAILTGPFLLFNLFSKSKRQNVLKQLFIWFLLILALVASLGLSGFVRHFCFEQMTVRARPLVAAIESYNEKIGHPPANLSALVPEYLPKIPDTGMGAYPDFNYVTPDDTDPWRLEVPCSLGLLNWDVCFYRPSKKYEAHEYGGGVEPIGDWRYVHE